MNLGKQITEEFNGSAAEELAATLKRVGTDASGWEIHLVDPNTGQRWVLDYPQSHLHGGGPPRLRKV